MPSNIEKLHTKAMWALRAEVDRIYKVAKAGANGLDEQDSRLLISYMRLIRDMRESKAEFDARVKDVAQRLVNQAQKLADKEESGS